MCPLVHSICLGLGVGLRKGSPWTHKISLAILELHEGGDMEKLDNQWILIESTECPERDHTPATLGLTNMAGEVSYQGRNMGGTDILP